MKKVWVCLEMNMVANGDLMEGVKILGVFATKEAAFEAHCLDWSGGGDEYIAQTYISGNSSCWNDFVLQEMEVEE